MPPTARQTEFPACKSEKRGGEHLLNTIQAVTRTRNTDLSRDFVNFILTWAASDYLTRRTIMKRSDSWM